MSSGVTKWMTEGADTINYILYMRFEMSTRTIKWLCYRWGTLPVPVHLVCHTLWWSAVMSPDVHSNRWKSFLSLTVVCKRISHILMSSCLDLSHKHARPIYSSGALTQDFWRDELGEEQERWFKRNLVGAWWEQGSLRSSPTSMSHRPARLEFLLCRLRRNLEIMVSSTW